ncbi:MAG: hypothetical protein WC705_00615 [Candidatus Paceibacterota bacterium]|jgi:hypothetical protein
MKPQIVIENYNPQGVNNANILQSVERLEKGKGYRDLSTICIVPTRGLISAKVTQAWMGLIAPMNQKFTRIFMIGMEVGEAYNAAIETILDNPDLSNWKYVLTLEEDNIPPPDGLIKLYENIDDYAALGGLYWTKGEGGQPMIYGDPEDKELNFRPQMPVKDIQECNGLGMGFTLFKLDLFKDVKIEKPWFKTCQEWDSQKGCKVYTQDLYFFEKIKKLSYKVACDTRVKVGHYSFEQDIVW